MHYYVPVLLPVLVFPVVILTQFLASFFSKLQNYERSYTKFEELKNSSNLELKEW